jgi:very-short-patch-repair endonuclease
MPVSLKCVQCNSDFNVKPSHSSRAKFCCRQCYLDYTKEHSKVTLVCSFCKTEFKVEPYKKSRLNRQFCSSRCAFDHKRLLASEFDDLIRNLYAQEWSIYEIGAVIYRLGTFVQSRLKAMGIPRRTASELRNGRFNPTRGKGHSEKTKQRLREKTIEHFSDPKNRERQAILTAKQIEEGRTGKFNNNLEKQVVKILLDLQIKFKQCYRIQRKVYDFKLLEYPILIESDGTFWHSDPRFYKDKPLTAIQLKNKQNDESKTQLAVTNGFILIRVWEYDIVNYSHVVKQEISELLKQLQLSAQINNCFTRISVFSD